MTEQEYSSESIEETQVPSCEERLVHLDNVRQLQLEILPMDQAQRRAELFNVLAEFLVAVDGHYLNVPIDRHN